MSTYSVGNTLEQTIITAACAYMETPRQPLEGINPKTLDFIEAFALDAKHRPLVGMIAEARRLQTRSKIVERRDERLSRAIDLRVKGGDQTEIDAELDGANTDDAEIAKLDHQAPPPRSKAMTTASMFGGER